jgi:hypothetical protein
MRFGGKGKKFTLIHFSLFDHLITFLLGNIYLLKRGSFRELNL